VLGSRYVPGGRVVNWPWYRNALSRSANTYSRRALRLPVRDVTGGFRLFRRPVLEEVTRAPVSSQGYCFQGDLACRFADGQGERAPLTEQGGGGCVGEKGIVGPDPVKNLGEAHLRLAVWAGPERWRWREDRLLDSVTGRFLPEVQAVDSGAIHERMVMEVIVRGVAQKILTRDSAELFDVGFEFGGVKCIDKRGLRAMPDGPCDQRCQ